MLLTRPKPQYDNLNFSTEMVGDRHTTMVQFKKHGTKGGDVLLLF